MRVNNKKNPNSFKLYFKNNYNYFNFKQNIKNKFNSLKL